MYFMGDVDICTPSYLGFTTACTPAVQTFSKQTKMIVHLKALTKKS